MKAFVTGGGGFLGEAIVKQLIRRGDRVRSFSRGEYPALKELGAEHRQGDLSDQALLAEAMEGADIVFHVAAKAGIWGPYDEFYRTNVQGTENIIRACRQLGIKKLVFTSTPSVIYNGKGIEGGDESLPYPESFESHYPKTKALAEQLVLKANDQTLSTVALRPHLIWGPGDHHFLPRLVARAKEGRLRILGRNKNLVDSVYIDNAAKAHLQAADKLYPGSPVAGKAYFITQGQPIPIADLINKILNAADVPPVEKTIPAPLAYLAGMLSESVYNALDLKSEPPMTRFLAKQLSTPHWFDISAARRDFGYDPEISIEQGMENLREWLKNNGKLKIEN
jgi:nucleoside-diphosphate-sugar epimerase